MWFGDLDIVHLVLSIVTHFTHVVLAYFDLHPPSIYLLFRTEKSTTCKTGGCKV